MSGWIWVLLAGVFEIGFTTALKLQQQDASYGVVFLVCAVVSFSCLSRALKTVPLSTAYALWTGIGAVGTIIIGAALFHESLSPLRILLLTLLIAVLVALKFATPQKQQAAS